MDDGKGAAAGETAGTAPDSVRSGAGRLPAHRAGRAFVNTISENHVIHLSDRLSVGDIRMVLIERLRSLVPQRRRAARGALGDPGPGHARDR
ncbi:MULTISPECIES: hypothetical protein [Nocardiopsis]|uniref:Uncharacterized protein n=1 Tax=Nocardiopsis dassonvillei (strain ATCC 23218 / DSM 43111 / CIP 107115 / JCM 7437 / KCTC 9190 / NBRC 14626 / NCTC 10488 / NRRL B-5397 / IMRU 509) TaxID=446468 RepID=D7B9M1_NOCDD|nr:MULTISPECIES: hypothetical protein [Nocardiopsis]ADH70879.1 hypothetical protein Ndas_5500 [Nocardiopsis dassonvillei subsp. dassonvillei DSM 43111]NKY78120.1 hypothetical protein [Nocardiopsis dassonvillei]VEI91089.1 Uncharacterised protein [Nocardiopsis dassonvillei]